MHVYYIYDVILPKVIAMGCFCPTYTTFHGGCPTKADLVGGYVQGLLSGGLLSGRLMSVY